MMTGLVVCVAVLAVTAGGGVLWRARNGRVRGVPAGPDGEGPRLSAADLGQPLGGRATLVQFSSAFCTPCRATRAVLAQVADQQDGVVHVEIDAESHLDLVRRLDVRRTPTVLVLDPDGQVARRASGQPRPAEVIAAISAAAGGEAARGQAATGQAAAPGGPAAGPAPAAEGTA